jgi:hypothetical protein
MNPLCANGYLPSYPRQGTVPAGVENTGRNATCVESIGKWVTSFPVTREQEEIAPKNQSVWEIRASENLRYSRYFSVWGYKALKIEVPSASCNKAFRFEEWIG